MINLMGLHSNVSITISNLDASGISLASASLARFQVIVFISEKNESRHFLLFADSEIANNVWEKFKTNSTARSSMHSTGTPSSSFGHFFLYCLMLTDVQKNWQELVLLI